MPIKINGSTSGSVTLAAPATGSDVTVTLPAAAGTIPLSASATLTTATLSDPTLTGNVVWSGATLRAATDYVATSQTTTSSTYTDLATAGPAVTLTTGTKALVIVTGRVYNGTSAYNALMSFAVSGATTLSADDSRSLMTQGQSATSGIYSFAFLLTGLTAGSNTFTAKYRAEATSTLYAQYRRLTVIDMGS